MKSCDRAIWVVYALNCISKTGKQSIYIGVTNDFDKRWEAHCSGNGAKYTKAFKPQSGIIIQYCGSKQQALKLERQFKRYTKEAKQIMIGIALLKKRGTNKIYYNKGV